MFDFLNTWTHEAWGMVVEAAPWLLVGFAIAGVVHAWLPLDKVKHHLGKPGWAGVLKASLIGIPLPLCSCSVIPVASSLRKQGASKGAFMSFLISTPETGVDSIAISYALLGPFLAIVRPIAAFVTAVIGGLLVDSATDETHGQQGADDDVRCDDDSCACPEDPNRNGATTGAGKVIVALRYAVVDLFADLAVWLVVGFVLAALLSAMIPDGFLEPHVGSGLLPMLLMLVVARDLQWRGLVLYLTAVAGVALLFGLLVDRTLVTLPPQVAALPESLTAEASPAATMAAVALALLTINGLRVRWNIKKGSGYFLLPARIPKATFSGKSSLTPFLTLSITAVSWNGLSPFPPMPT